MKRLASWLGVDRAIFFTVLTRVWSASAGLITIALVSQYLSPELQGYYYTFCSLIALQVFAELGLTYTIVQFTSHEMARLAWSAEGYITGDPIAKRRLQSLIFSALKLLSVFSVVVVVLLAITGLLFFGAVDPANVSTLEIMLPWLILVIFTALNMILNAIVAAIEGGGRVADVAVLRLCQSISSVAVIWLLLRSGGNLFALAASSVVLVVVSFIWLWLNFRKCIKDIYHLNSDIPGIDWRAEVWSFQWRMAVSNISGFFIFQLFTPILFLSHGPIAAGQMGMTMQIVGAMNGIAIAWIATKSPMYGKLVATNEFSVLDKVFFRGVLQSLALLMLGSSTVFATVKYLESISSPYIERVLPPYLFAALMLVGLVGHVLSSEAFYLRAHKNEPFMGLSVFLGVLTAFLAIVMIPDFGAAGAVISYSIPTLLIGLPWGTIVFIRSRNQTSLFEQ